MDELSKAVAELSMRTVGEKLRSETLDEQILTILRDNITFSGQVGDYVVHGAIAKIKKLIADEAGKAWDAGRKMSVPISAVALFDWKVKKEDYFKQNFPD